MGLSVEQTGAVAHGVVAVIRGSINAEGVGTQPSETIERVVAIVAHFPQGSYENGPVPYGIILEVGGLRKRIFRGYCLRQRPAPTHGSK
jgi:hypothetical protein